MRFLSSLLLLVTLVVPVMGQRKSAEPAPATSPAPATTAASHANPQADPKVVYALALKYRDPSVAIMAVYEQLAHNPTDRALKDSLASLYFISRSYPQALAVAQEVLAAEPQNAKMLQLVAISEQSLGRNKEALEAYEKLYAVSKNTFHLYQVAVLQYSLTRLGECMSSLAQVIQAQDAGEQKVAVAINQQQAQEVPLKAAAWNVRGVVLRDQKDPANAKLAFDEALKVFPDFILAKNNLAELAPKPAAKPAPGAKPAPTRPSGR